MRGTAWHSYRGIGQAGIAGMWLLGPKRGGENLADAPCATRAEEEEDPLLIGLVCDPGQRWRPADKRNRLHLWAGIIATECPQEQTVQPPISGLATGVHNVVCPSLLGSKVDPTGSSSRTRELHRTPAPIPLTRPSPVVNAGHDRVLHSHPVVDAVDVAQSGPGGAGTVVADHLGRGNACM